MKNPLLSTILSVVSIIAGFVTCWALTRSEIRTIKNEMEEEIRKEMKVSEKLTRLDERYEQLKKELWQHTQSGHQ